MKIKVIYLFIFVINLITSVLFAQMADTLTVAVEEDSSIQVQSQKRVIDQQFNSPIIINLVSPVRIRDLQDANIVESIGRLPGVSLLRTGGQATQLIIRGFNPEFNQITIGGVPVPANESYRSSLQGITEFGGGRGVDLRITPSGSLDDITVYKTYTPDMDAAFLGGTVDLGIRKAGKSLAIKPFGFSYLPTVSLQAQGGYTDITNEYNNYAFDLSLEKRFLDEKFGVLVQGSIQQQNLTSNRLDADYSQPNKDTDPDRLGLTSLNLYLYPRLENRYNGTVTLDYDIPYGSLAFTNIFSQSSTKTDRFSQQYDIGQRGGNNIYYYANRSPNEINLITNIFNYNQDLPLFNIEASLSHSYSENVSPDSWTIGFHQQSAGTININEELSPVKIAEQAHQRVDFDELEMRTINTENGHNKQKEWRGAIDLSRNFQFNDLFSLQLKAGTMYTFSDRSHDYNSSSGFIWYGEVGHRIFEAFPWLAEYGIDPYTSSSFFLTPFIDPDINTGTFLKGDYTFDNKLNMDYMRRIKEIVVDYSLSLEDTPTGGTPAWVVPDMFRSVSRDYSGTEDRSAVYLMGTFNISQMFTVIAGARYQNLTTKYTANRFYNADFYNTYPYPYPGKIDTTFKKSHGNWLPAFHLIYKPFNWLSIRSAYTQTLTYPNFSAIIPLINIYGQGYVDWNDVNLKAAQSENIDLQFSIYDNTLGLFTIAGFMKHIDDFVLFKSGYITNPQNYEGLHDVAQYPSLDVSGYKINTFYNSPNPVKVWGIESSWQTHFWYLPNPLNGLQLNVNYTHIFSEVSYPKTLVYIGFPPQPVITDTTYKDYLINQPEDIINISLGWDYKNFSILLNMKYLSNIFAGINYYNVLRSDKAEYMRWDLATRQKLPWYNMEIFLNVNNLTGEEEVFHMRGNSFPLRRETYGLTAELGFRVSFN